MPAPEFRPSKPSNAPETIEQMLPGIYLQVKVDSIVKSSGQETGQPKDALDLLLERSLTEGQVLRFRPDADYFMDLKRETGTGSQFDEAANAEVSRNSHMALAAALAGAKLTSAHRELAVTQLNDCNNELKSRWNALHTSIFGLLPD
jgi:hypothetical protein